MGSIDVLSFGYIHTHPQRHTHTLSHRQIHTNSHTLTKAHSLTYRMDNSFENFRNEVEYQTFETFVF